MKRDNLITWLKILWVLMGFLLFPLLYTFLPVFHKPYFIIGYVVMMMAAIYMIFIRERADPVEPLAVLPPRSALMAVIKYSPDEGEGEGEEKRECVICLNEFEKDEELAKMGCCGSMFHAQCVAKWAQSHSRTCPICHESYIISVQPLF